MRLPKDMVQFQMIIPIIFEPKLVRIWKTQM